MSNLQRNVHKMRNVPHRSPRMFQNYDCTPSNWSKYFTEKRDVECGCNKFRVYMNGSTGPILILLHGGGYSALTWSLFTQEISQKVECQIVAIDLRGHGCSETDNEMDLSLETLAADVYNVIIEMFGDMYPSCVIIGHSMGGAVAVETAQLLIGAVGMCVIDVVEGTALESLSGMQSILRGRPSHFKSKVEAIQWSYKSGQTHNLEAARVSMPGQIKNVETGRLASEECAAITEKVIISGEAFVKVPSAATIETIEEQPETCSTQNVSNGLPPSGLVSSASPFKTPKRNETAGYCWRIDLSKTETFWNGWFNGLSQKFLDVVPPKILVLANIGGLDTTLTVGQMQGKFQLQVLSRSGHAIHEDQPEHVADIIAGFLVKQRLAVSKDGFTPPLPGC